MLYKVGRDTIDLVITKSSTGYLVHHRTTGRAVRIPESDITNVGLHDTKRVYQRVAELAAERLK